MSPLRSFGLGQLSAAVEPLAAALGAGAVLLVGGLLPYALGFAAGAMIYVVAEALLPEARRNGHSDAVTLATGIGFAFMTALALGLA
jgi:ZIP family zinc transporter